MADNSATVEKNSVKLEADSVLIDNISATGENSTPTAMENNIATGEDNGAVSGPIANPWPYLKSFFEFKCKTGNSLKFICVLCRPKVREISAYVTSPSNLGKHIKAKHGLQHYEYYQDLTSMARKRKINGGPGSSKRKKSNLNGPHTVQGRFDQNLISLVAQGLLPLQFVALPSFRQLVRSLQPSVEIMNVAAMEERIDSIASDMKVHIIAALSTVDFIATTVDCWSVRQHDFIGITAHWIDAGTLERCRAALACRRLTGQPTHDVLTFAINDTHSIYGIEQRVIYTTTDNGTNYLKKFSALNFNDEEGGAASEQKEEDTDTDVEFLDAFEILASKPECQYKLPTLQRCACHILHLVATEDSAHAALDEEYKDLNNTTFSKLSLLWNMEGRSSQKSVMQLIRPHETRWTSLFHGAERIVAILRSRGDSALQNIFSCFEVPTLTEAELDFLIEYCAVLKPVMKAIDILKSEKTAYMGWLLPTLRELLVKLEIAEGSSRVCKPLVTAIIKGIQTRFSAMMDEPQLISAAILLPKFRTEWTSDSGTIEKGLNFLREKLTEMREIPVDLSQEQEEDDDFFSSLKNRRSAVFAEVLELNSYLSTTSHDLEVLQSFPNLKKLFIRLNTPLPASAACEGLFDTAESIFIPSYAAIDSKHFENQVLLKLNGRGSM